MLYHRDIDVKGLADVSLSYDSDICLFTYGLVDCRLLWSGHKALAVDSLCKSCYNRIMHPYFGPTYTVDQAPSPTNIYINDILITLFFQKLNK